MRKLRSAFGGSTVKRKKPRIRRLTSFSQTSPSRRQRSTRKSYPPGNIESAIQLTKRCVPDLRKIREEFSLAKTLKIPRAACFALLRSFQVSYQSKFSI